MVPFLVIPARVQLGLWFVAAMEAALLHQLVDLALLAWPC